MAPGKSIDRAEIPKIVIARRNNSFVIEETRIRIASETRKRRSVQPESGEGGLISGDWAW